MDYNMAFHLEIASYHIISTFFPHDFQTRPKLSINVRWKIKNDNITHISTAYSTNLIYLSAKTNNILLPLTFPPYTITEPPDFCVIVYFCLRVPKFLWHQFEIAACAAVRLRGLLPLG